MALSAPSIVGALSPLSVSVRMRDQIAGAKVMVFHNGTQIARHTASAPDEIFAFDPGIVLNAGDKITARQEWNGETSQETPLPTLVQQLTPPLDGHRFISHIYRCGTSLFLAGIVPGAEIRLSDGATVLGSALSVDGGAVVRLFGAIGANQEITAQQIILGVAGPPVISPRADDPPGLHNFFFEEPMACMIAIKAHSLADGAEAVVRHKADDPTTERVFDAPIDHMPFPTPPLVAGENVSVQVRMLRCQLASGLVVRRVLPPNPPQPVIETPLCAGAKRLTVGSLLAGALVTARQGTNVVGFAQASSEKLDMWTEPLAATGQPVVVTADLCGVTRNSAPQHVAAQPETIPPCRIVEPLMDCSMTLWVEIVHPGALLAAFSDKRGQISEWRSYADKTAKIDLSSPLQTDHLIRVVQIACGGGMENSENEPRVQAIPQLNPPDIVQPIFADHRTVSAKAALPGALVQLYTRESGFISSAVADQRGVAVMNAGGISRHIIGQHAFVRQILCNQISKFGEFAGVIDRTPLAPTILAPPNGGPNQPQRPTLNWSDPGAGTVRQASAFLVELTTASNPGFTPWIVNEVVSSTSFTPASDLAFGTPHIWRVTGFLGDPGFEVRGPASTAGFTVKSAPPPPPPPPIIDSVAKDSATGKYQVKGRLFLASHAVLVRVVNEQTFQSDLHSVTSDGAGNLDVKITVPSLPAGTKLAFSANDGRSDPDDLTGTLWSNTFHITL